MKNIIASLLLTLSLSGPAWGLAQEPGTEVQAKEVPAAVEAATPVPAEEAAIPDPAVEENGGFEIRMDLGGELHEKSRQDLLNEIEDLVQRAASGDLAGADLEAVKLRIRTLRERIANDTPAPWESKSAGGLLIAGLAVVLIFGTPILLVAAVLYANYRKRRLMHNTIDQYVSSGRDIPPEVLQSLHQQVTPGNNLNRGLVMTGVGLGVIACFLVMGAREAAALGLIPLFIGLAQLLIWKLEKKQAS